MRCPDYEAVGENTHPAAVLVCDLVQSKHAWHISKAVSTVQRQSNDSAIHGALAIVAPKEVREVTSKGSYLSDVFFLQNRNAEKQKGISTLSSCNTHVDNKGVVEFSARISRDKYKQTKKHQKINFPLIQQKQPLKMIVVRDFGNVLVMSLASGVN